MKIWPPEMFHINFGPVCKLRNLFISVQILQKWEISKFYFRFTFRHNKIKPQKFWNSQNFGGQPQLSRKRICRICSNFDIFHVFWFHLNIQSFSSGVFFLVFHQKNLGVNIDIRYWYQSNIGTKFEEKVKNLKFSETSK